MLAVQAERAPRSDDQMQGRQCRQQVCDQNLGLADQLFEVVQHQQGAAPRQRRGECGPRRIGAGGNLQRRGHGIERLRLGRAGRQRDEGHQIEGLERFRSRQRPGGVLAQRMRHLDRQARLAGAARADQRDQAPDQHQAAQPGALFVGTEHSGQVVAQRDAGRRHRGRPRRGARFGGQRGHRCRLPHRQALVQRRQAHPLVVDPRVVKTRQQLTAVQGTRGVNAAGLKLTLEVRHVAGQAVGHHANAGAVGDQDRLRRRPAGRFEEAFQARQHLAQPVAADPQLDPGPKTFDQFFACVCALRPHRQARQQRNGGAAGQAVQALPAVTDLEPAEQPHLPHGIRQVGRRCWRGGQRGLALGKAWGLGHGQSPRRGVKYSRSRPPGGRSRDRGPGGVPAHPAIESPDAGAHLGVARKPARTRRCGRCSRRVFANTASCRSTSSWAANCARRRNSALPFAAAARCDHRHHARPPVCRSTAGRRQPARTA